MVSPKPAHWVAGFLEVAELKSTMVAVGHGDVGFKADSTMDSYI